jgi:8-oxo-dGTP pyrophosphatase MutT (NUDIX family)
MMRRLIETFRIPPKVQVAALCLRDGTNGPEVMMVRSLERGVWILPKGWPIPGKTLAEAARIEAWEEAGVHGTIATQAMARVPTLKRKSKGLPVQCETHVFRLDVTSTEDIYPEADKRTRAWMSLEQAAGKAGEPAIASLLTALANQTSILDPKPR